jgi:MarR family transcriptional repressor of emrRAB
MMSKRLENLLGALAVALSDSLSVVVEAATGHAGAISAALATLAQEPGLGIEQLRVPLGRTQSATVRIVDQLVADGHAERRPGRDQRSVAVVLTEKGMAAAGEVLDRRRNVLGEAIAALEPAQQRALEPIVAKLLTALTTGYEESERICRLCDVAACPQRICPVELAVPSKSREPGRPRARPIASGSRSRSGQSAAGRRGAVADRPGTG